MNQLFGGIYKDRKVLVTGHTGFKGSWLCTWLLELGAEVIGYALNPHTTPSMFECCELKDKMRSVIGDIRDLKSLSDCINAYQPEIIFHLAAQPLVRQSYHYPKQTYETNVLGTLHVYEAARQCQSVKAIVCVTTDKCYENKESIYGYRETDRLGGYDPYSSSKACVELLSDSYRQSFFNEEGVKVATVRAGNVIGGGDWSMDRLIPDAIRSLTQHQTIILRNPLAIRPWQHVLEPLSGYLYLGYQLLSKKNTYASSWNFGPYESSNQTVEVVIQEVIKYYKVGKYVIDTDEHLHETQLLKLDINKAKKYLDWYPVYDYQTAIEKTITWYKKYYMSKENMYNLTKNQIDEYIHHAQLLNLKWSGGDGHGHG
ncbi:MAG: CDP-glucose 4,6-dehydratase [Turicibacter sp.]|nr:CDP-glucose 4,6-dehydratase [Turicibacter sp.]